MKHLLCVLLLLPALGALGACGFYLKGQRPLPEGMGNVSLSYENPYAVQKPELIRALERRLRAQRKASENKEIPSRLNIRSVTLENAVLSVSPLDGTAAEYELLAEAYFDFRHKGDEVLTNTKVSARRVFSVDNTERLAAEAESEDLVDAMHEEMADLILLKIENELKLKVQYRNVTAGEQPAG